MVKKNVKKKEVLKNAKALRSKVVHMVIKKNGQPYYSCNHAVTPDWRKLSADWKKVTCQNCLKNDYVETSHRLINKPSSHHEAESIISAEIERIREVNEKIKQASPKLTNIFSFDFKNSVWVDGFLWGASILAFVLILLFVLAGC